jgi:hypothetical protein
MQGRVPRSQFPAYPMIKPETGVSPVDLFDYCNMYKPIAGSRVVLLSELLQTTSHA